MKCPHGWEVGKPADPDLCPWSPLGKVRGCLCMAELQELVTVPHPDPALQTTLSWWQEHGDF